jgi:hypothetical protein
MEPDVKYNSLLFHRQLLNKPVKPQSGPWVERVCGGKFAGDVEDFDCPETIDENFLQSLQTIRGKFRTRAAIKSAYLWALDHLQ